jgi:maleate isomerase
MERGDEAYQVRSRRMTAEFDQGIAGRGAIGVIVLATEKTLECEWRKLFTMNGIAVYESRIMSPRLISVESLATMKKDIAYAAQLIQPGEPLHVLAYACTSGAMVIGEAAVFELMRRSHSEAACTTPITGALAAFEALQVKRVALLTPYVEQVNEMMRGYLEARNIAVPAIGSFYREDDGEVARISPASIKSAVVELGRHGEVDAVFVSCTTLRVAEIAQSAEDLLGKPVISSNLALAWHSLRLAGYNEPVPGWGALLRR